MEATEINWRHNCLTDGIHDGRPDHIWNIPLNYAVIIFSRDSLKELVISRIYNDAMEIVENSGGNTRFTQEWADRVKEIAEERFDTTLQHTVGEISNYYNSPSFKADIERAAQYNVEDKLNTHYAPLHSHDSINMLCRILGDTAKRRAAS